jgi:phytoene/squalene synthetase
MFRVMQFDVERRGRLVSGDELADYSRWLAIAVTEAMHQFIGHGRASGDGDRYAAVTGAHIVHMLRDTEVDVAAGYYNVPGEVLRDASIGPRDIRCDAYRAWVGDRLRSARTELEAGRRYFAGVESVRLRLAGFAYIARFTEVARSLEHGGLQVGGPNDDGRSLAAGFRAGASALVWMARPHRLAPHPTPAVPAGEDRV